MHDDDQLDSGDVQIKAFLEPLAELPSPDRSPHRPRIFFSRSRKTALTVAALVALGGGAAVAATQSTQPQEITVIDLDGSTHPGLLCQLPDIKLQKDTEFKDANGISGLQPGEPCPTVTNPADSGNRGIPRK